jgi:hypothetical protein
MSTPTEPTEQAPTEEQVPEELEGENPLTSVNGTRKRFPNPKKPSESHGPEIAAPSTIAATANRSGLAAIRAFPYQRERRGPLGNVDLISARCLLFPRSSTRSWYGFHRGHTPTNGFGDNDAFCRASPCRIPLGGRDARWPRDRAFAPHVRC